MQSPINSCSTPDYTMGYGEEYLRFSSKVRVEEAIALLQPRLEPGNRVLDLGCGMGHISLALARSVAPGKVCGIDMEPTQVELCRELVAELGVANVVFEVADAARLPFDDGYFDAVNCCDILAYIPDTYAVLAEVKRVLKPGGIVHCREMIIETSYVYPSNKVLDRGWGMFSDLLLWDDGHPQLGKGIHVSLEESGFTDVDVSPTYEIYAGHEGVESFFNLVEGWFIAPDLAEAATSYGAATQDEFARLATAMAAWKDQPGAYAAIAFGRTVGVRP